MFVLSKVISGGQTGVDQGALRAAAAMGFAVGGWCPPGRMSEDERIPDGLPLKETLQERSENAPHIPRSQRTEWNVRDSDGTLLLWPSDLNREDPGTRWTAECAARYGRPTMVCDPGDLTNISKVQEWLEEKSIKTLNVAGPSESSSRGIGRTSEKFLREVLRVALLQK